MPTDRCCASDSRSLTVPVSVSRIQAQGLGSRLCSDLALFWSCDFQNVLKQRVAQETHAPQKKLEP